MMRATMKPDPRTHPLRVKAPRNARTLGISWADGHEGTYPHDILRGYCPCAGCQGHSGEIRFIEPRDDQLELEDIESVGGYALALKWFDGHASGIYSFVYLRRLCQCDACRSPERGAMPRM